MKDAIGGNGLASAYCLFYVKQDLLIKTSRPFWDFELDNPQESVYKSFVPGHILSEVLDENKKLDEEVAAYQVSFIYNKIQTLYDTRLDEINRIYKENLEKKPEQLRVDLINFTFHLKIMKGPDLFKKYLLDLCVKEVTGNNIESFAFTDPVYTKLKLHFPTLVLLNKIDKENIEKELIVYTNDFFDAEVSVLISNYLIQGQFEDAFKALLFQNESISSSTNEYQNSIRSFARALALRLASQVSFSIKAQHFPQALVCSSIVGFIIVNLLESNDYIKKVAVKRLESARDEFKNYQRHAFTEYEKSFSELFKEIESGDILAKIDFTMLPEEIENIKAKRVAFEPNTWFVCNKNTDPAATFVKIKARIEENSIYDWVKLAEILGRSRSYSEKPFKDLEKRYESLMNCS